MKERHMRQTEQLPKEAKREELPKKYYGGKMMKMVS